MQDLNAKLPKDIDGTLSLTCWPMDALTGPKLWFLLPLGKGPSLSFPLKKNHYSFMEWINEIRARESLNPLGFNDLRLNQSLKTLTSDSQVEHDKNKLLQIKSDLKKEGLTLLGENRGLGKNLEEIFWLLWNSPQHRNLLLQPDAHFGGIAVKKNQDQTLLAVILIAM